MYLIPTKNSLHFRWTDVSKALDEVRVSDKVRPLYGRVTGPGLWLVGDEGVYLMSNAISGHRTIAYARECDPTKLDFDVWWANKGRMFGTGDSIEFIALREIDQLTKELHSLIKSPRHLFVEMSAEKFAIGIL